MVGEECGELVVHKHLRSQLRDQLDDGSEGQVVVPAHIMRIRACSLFDFLNTDTFCGGRQGSQEQSDYFQ